MRRIRLRAIAAYFSGRRKERQDPRDYTPGHGRKTKAARIPKACYCRKEYITKQTRLADPWQALKKEKMSENDNPN